MTTHMSYYSNLSNTDYQVSIDPFLLNRKPTMAEGNLFNIPLSPPTSPRMSFQSGQEGPWAKRHSQQLDASDSKMALLLQAENATSLTLDTKTILPVQRSYSYPVQHTSVPIDTPSLHGGDSPAISEQELVTPSLGDLASSDIPQVVFGGSTPVSPLSNFMPTSPHKDPSMGAITGLGISMGEEEDDDMLDEEDSKKPMTAAEIRAHKRKMKRFRLTHNQTRFLMSEFARQAHPDAAHRERLAREIPGLTPRQVQVWFQNRRAKLKRLTSDDRERMMRSRALPDDFDMTQALHSPFGAIQNVNSNLPSPSYSAMADGSMLRPLTMESLRRMPDSAQHMSPISGFGGFNFTPPQSVMDSMSPVSAPGDGPFGYSTTLGDRRSNPFGGPLTSPSAFTSHPHLARLQVHEQQREPRSRAEALTSPLRTTLSSYSAHSELTSPTSPLVHHPESSGPPSMMFGLSYSC